jgi:hypothetical protein
MLKRLLSTSIALLGTIVGIAVFWIVFMPWFHFATANDQWPKLGLALVELAATLYFFKRWRSWSALLLLIGSVPMVLVNVSYVGWMWRMDRYDSKSPPVDDPLLAMLFPSDNEQSAINTVLYYLIWFSMACLSIAFFWCLFKVIHRRLANL